MSDKKQARSIFDRLAQFYLEGLRGEPSMDLRKIVEEKKKEIDEMLNTTSASSTSSPAPTHTPKKVHA